MQCVQILDKYLTSLDVGETSLFMIALCDVFSIQINFNIWRLILSVDKVKLLIE